MDEGEGDGAEAGELNHHVLVFFDALHVAGVAGERPSGDAHVLSLLEVAFPVDLALSGVGGCKEFYETYLFVGDWLNIPSFFITVDPQRHHTVGQRTAALFNLQYFDGGLPYEQQAWYYRSDAHYAG